MCRFLLLPLLLAVFALNARAELPLSTRFKGRAKFDALVAKAPAWKALPIGERTAAVGRELVGTPYKSHTLEIDDRIEAPSVNFDGLDCWTFFETALAFARMLDRPRDQWTPETLLQYIELDRYRGGECDGSYLSRLHYLEDWLYDNDKRGLVQDLTKRLGGVKTKISAVEMTRNWKSYRYMRNDAKVRQGIAAMESNVVRLGLWHIPKDQVKKIEGSLRSGDIIGITTYDGGRVGTSHVGLAVQEADGIHFMHASAPRNFGRVVVDSRLTEYLARFRSNAGIIVGRPLR